MKVVAVDSSEIICASVDFSEGNITDMHAKDFDFDNGLDNIDFENDFLDE